jgi:hypothetical protein
VSGPSTEMPGTMIDPVPGGSLEEMELAQCLPAQTVEQGAGLVGSGGSPNQLTKNAPGTAPTEHLVQPSVPACGGQPVGTDDAGVGLCTWVASM